MFVSSEEEEEKKSDEKNDGDGECLGLMLNVHGNVLEEGFIGSMPRSTAQVFEERCVCLATQHILFAVEHENGIPQVAIQLNLNGDAHRTGGDDDGGVR